MMALNPAADTSAPYCNAMCEDDDYSGPPMFADEAEADAFIDWWMEQPITPEEAETLDRMGDVWFPHIKKT